MTVLLWFRRDLRLTDNPALAAALSAGEPIVPVYVREEDEAGKWAPGAASRWWLHGSLQALSERLDARGARLVLRSGPAAEALAGLAQETGARMVVWSRRHEPWAEVQDAIVQAALYRLGVQSQVVDGALLHDVEDLRTSSGGSFHVFSAFWRALRSSLRLPQALPAPAAFPPQPPAWSEPLESWRMRPSHPDWARGLRGAWTPGETGALQQLERFTRQSLLRYHDRRDLPAAEASSRLSPHLHFGEIGPRQIWRAVTAASCAMTGEPFSQGAEKYLSEIAWREFAYHLLNAHPSLPEAPLKPEFARIAWREAPGELRLWREGRTGYPMVDAGLRQLWATGWMHNRARMVTASFLTKHLLIDWRKGEAWFWDTLVDADLANNSLGWQWVAGCGADAAPFFRVFNPVAQGRRFDPDGAYVRRWVPELAGLPDALIHAPWTARPIDLAAAGVALGIDYPSPMVDHACARRRALAAYEAATAGIAPTAERA